MIRADLFQPAAVIAKIEILCHILTVSVGDDTTGGNDLAVFVGSQHHAGQRVAIGQQEGFVHIPSGGIQFLTLGQILLLGNDQHIPWGNTEIAAILALQSHGTQIIGIVLQSLTGEGQSADLCSGIGIGSCAGQGDNQIAVIQCHIVTGHCALQHHFPYIHIGGAVINLVLQPDGDDQGPGGDPVAANHSTGEVSGTGDGNGVGSNINGSAIPDLGVSEVTEAAHIGAGLLLAAVVHSGFR